jgi:diadenosine tetraphosphatase ApaH/serine/threonine PP2A family protein phosphatase
MRAAVVSDVHANLVALEAVLAEIDAWAPDELWCLGDVVGYGPAPNECCALVEERVDVALVGNHDLVALGDLSAEDFNDDARAAAEWTRARLDDRGHAFLSRLAPLGEAGGCELFHASARDPVWEYVLSAEAAYASLLETTAPVVLVGHSHVALAIGLEGGDLRGGLAPADTRIELGGRWLLNPGSVGQPRDGDPRAAWLALDLDAGVAEFHRVDYAVADVQHAILAEGLPPALADRLAHGV